MTVLPSVEGQHADLGPGEKLLDHHMVAGGAELFVQHDLFHAVGGLLLVLADQHALAQGQAVGLDDDGVLALCRMYAMTLAGSSKVS